MNISCYKCGKNIKKYISFDYKRGYLVNAKFRGQEKYFCSPRCVVEFIEDFDDQPKGVLEPKKLYQWKIPACLICGRRNEDNIITNYRESWVMDLMRYKGEKNHFCSLNCFREYFIKAFENCKKNENIKSDSKEYLLKLFDKMIEWVLTQPVKNFPDKFLIKKAIGFNWNHYNWPQCNKYGMRCELCSLFEDGYGCLSGLRVQLNSANTWEKWLKVAYEIVEYIKDNG